MWNKWLKVFNNKLKSPQEYPSLDNLDLDSIYNKNKWWGNIKID